MLVNKGDGGFPFGFLYLAGSQATYLMLYQGVSLQHVSEDPRFDVTLGLLIPAVSTSPGESLVRVKSMVDGDRR